MRFLAPIVAAGAWVLLAATAEAGLVYVGEYGGRPYCYQSTLRPYAEARDEAVSMGGHLVCINNDAENAWLASSLAPLTPTLARVAWIGLANHGQGWQWESGEAVNYTNWRPAGVGPGWAEPTGDDAGCMYLADTQYSPPIPLGLWGDTYSTDGWPSIYEGVAPEPATLSLLALGGLVLLRRRRGASS